MADDPTPSADDDRKGRRDPCDEGRGGTTEIPKAEAREGEGGAAATTTTAATTATTATASVIVAADRDDDDDVPRRRRGRGSEGRPTASDASDAAADAST